MVDPHKGCSEPEFPSERALGASDFKSVKDETDCLFRFFTRS
jgi:hypothetical protein